ncbi:MAG TPA: ABC transporter substrate-binding protein [Acidimicrobiales bacterium]|nr:ABC transporter substrate-binding protein [Acidimicrobiales bacterium]
MHRRPTHVRLLRLAALAASLSLLAAACSSSKGGSSNAGTTPGTAAPALVPKAGGSLTVATEAEVTTGFDPFNSDWDATGLSYASTVYDMLTAVGDDGSTKPYLAQSITPNADFTQWTITARPGISFTNGEPFNADSIKLNLDTHLKSPLTSPVLFAVASVTKVDAMTVQVNMKSPWADFPQILAGQLGAQVAPKAIADAKNLATHPIGTGPFIFQSWVQGDHFTATKNPNYWRKDASGNSLPYLDSVTFKPIVDPQSRENSLKSGVVDLMHGTDTQTIVDFRQDKTIHLLEQTKGRVEQDFVMLNVTRAPLDDIRIRQALAMGLDQTRYNQVINNGIVKVTNGPFSDASGYVNGGSYPAYNPTAAKALVAAYEADHHVSKVEFEFGTTNTGKNLQSNQLVADMWSQIGITAHVVQVEQSQYISNAVLGNYQAYGWRQFAEPDPDADLIWWGSSFAKPNGQLSLNFARNQDPVIDQNMIDARSTSDAARRKTDYQNVSAQLNKDLPFIWTNQAAWFYAAKPSVEGIDNHTLPDGTAARSLFAGVVVPTQLWVNH